MDRSLMDILACPTCKGVLDLSVQDEQDGRIVTGTLQCPRCGLDYDIRDGIPNLMPKTTATG